MIDANHERMDKDHRLMRVAELYLEGKNQWEISRELGVHQSTISRDLKEVRKQWRESAINCFADWQDRELQVLDSIETEAWRGWNRSKKNEERTKEGKNGKGETYSETTTVGQAGDPRFLETIRGCVQRRCDILGLDAPKKNEITGSAPVSRQQMDADIRNRLTAVLNKNKQN